MATPDPREIQRLIKQLNEVEKKISDISGNPITVAFDGETDPQKIADQFGSVNKAIDFINKSIKRANTELETFTGALGATRSIVKDINAELKRINDPVKKARQSFGRIDSLVQQMTYNQADLNSLSVADIKNQKKKAQLYFNQIRLRKEELKTARQTQQEELAAAQEAFKKDPSEKNEKAVIAKRQELNATRELLSIAEDKNTVEENINNTYDSQIKKIENMNSGLGISGKIVEGIGGGLEKLGFKGFSSEVEKAQEKMKELSVQLSENGEKAVGLGGKFKVLAAGLSSLGSSLTGLFTDPIFYLGLLAKGVQKLVGLFTHLDNAIAKVGKNLGLSNESANRLTFELKAQAVASDEIGVSMDRLIGAQLEISKSLGTNVKLTAQQLEDQVYLAEFAGMQGEALVNAYKASTLLGKSSESMYDSILATNDTIFQTKELFEDAVNTTGQIATNLGNNPVAIAKAVGEAKRLGITLDTARSMADSTLDFESSIAAEMEAQVLTGRSINLNNARQLAFQGDHIGAAKEMLKQVGSLEEFSNMNVLAQQSLAKAMNLSTDELANQLRDAEFNRKVAARAAKEGISFEEAKLKALDENRTIGETINDIATRLGDIFGSLVKGPLTQVRKLLSNTDGIVKKIKEGFLGAFDATKNGGKSLASMVPTAESLAEGAKNIGAFFGKALNFISSIPDRLKGLAENPIFQFISSLFGENGTRNLAIAGGVGVLGKMLLGRGSRMNPMYVVMGKGGLIQKSFDTLKNIFVKKGGQSIAKQAGAKGAGAIMKATGKKVYGAAATSAVKAGTASLAKTGGKSVAKQAGKLGAKALGKSLLKKIPGVGLLAGVGFGLQRALSGDFAGAALELASGAASTIPGIGTGLSIAADAALVARDLSRAKKLNELQQTVDAPTTSQEVPVSDFVIKPLEKDTISMAGGTKLGGNVEALLETLIQEVRNGGDVIMDGRKVGSTLQLASYKL